jgi:hypothetical protein
MPDVPEAEERAEGQWADSTRSHYVEAFRRQIPTLGLGTARPPAVAGAAVLLQYCEFAY